MLARLAVSQVPFEQIHENICAYRNPCHMVKPASLDIY